VIALQRLAEPAVLAENGEKWLERFLEQRENTPGQRPDSRQYGHREIRNTLRAMSFHKCFYCERKLSESEDEIDHYIEVAESPEQAFRWENLYLSCRDCNRKKLPNLSIPVRECLNPCDSSVDPSEYLTFSDEAISTKSRSKAGSRTIQKYQLDRDDLNYARSRHLQKLTKLLLAIQTSRLNDGGRAITHEEKEKITHFQHPDHPFSLMFGVILAHVEL